MEFDLGKWVYMNAKAANPDDSNDYRKTISLRLPADTFGLLEALVPHIGVTRQELLHKIVSNGLSISLDALAEANGGEFAAEVRHEAEDIAERFLNGEY